MEPEGRLQMYWKSLCCPRGITAHQGSLLSCPMKPSPLLPNTDLHASHFESFELISAGSASMCILAVCFSLYLLLQTQYILNSELKFLLQEASPPLLSSHWPFEKLPNAMVLTCHIILWCSFKTTVHLDIEPSWYSDYPVFTKHWAQFSAPHEGMVVPTCNPSIWEVGVGRSEFKEIFIYLSNSRATCLMSDNVSTPSPKRPYCYNVYQHCLFL